MQSDDDPGLRHTGQAQEMVDCFDAKTAAEVRRFAYPYQDDFGFDEGPRGTPAVADEKVYTMGAEGSVHCLDFKTGKPIWQVDCKKDFQSPKGFFGMACSSLPARNEKYETPLPDCSTRGRLLAPKRVQKVRLTLECQHCFSYCPARIHAKRMNAKLRECYRNATDFITFVKLTAPDFPPRPELTVEQAIARVHAYLDDLHVLEKDQTALHWLKLCRQSTNAAQKLFTEKNDSTGRKELDSARTFLMNASTKRPMQTTFIVGETGQAEDLNSGFPS